MKKVLFAGLALFALCALFIVFLAARMLSGLPSVAVLKHYRPAAAAEVQDKDGAVLTEYFDRKFRIWVPITSLPDIVIHAVVTAEDDTFFEHNGVNYKATWDALVHDVQKRRFARGGSTITQQMIKNVLLSKEKTITRKVREYVLARRAEEILTKRQILQIYLNEVEWGDNVYGIEAASRYYFDKHTSELTIGEAALLAGMLPNPHYYNPFKRPDKARDRQERVLGNMRQAKLITGEEYEAALHAPFNLRQAGSGRFGLSALTATTQRPCYQNVLEQILLRMFGDQKVYRGGLTVRTSLDKNLQNQLTGLEEPSQSREEAPPDQITVVQEGGLIRAILCSPGKEQAVRDLVQTPVFPPSASVYEVSVLSPDAVTREQILLSVSGDKDGVRPRSVSRKSGKNTKKN